MPIGLSRSNECLRIIELLNCSEVCIQDLRQIVTDKDTARVFPSFRLRLRQVDDVDCLSVNATNIPNSKTTNFLAPQALLESVLKGQEFKVTRQRVTRDASGAKVRHTVDRQVKAWWFAQGAGAGAAVFVQAKYGTKVIALSGAGNSVQVATVGDVAAVLSAIKDAVVGG